MPFITQSPEGEKTPHGVNKTNWKFLMTVVVLAIIVSGGIFWYLIRKEVIYQPPEIRGPGKVYETADWQTYRDEGNGFEIKYPKEWYMGDNNMFSSKNPYERDHLKESIMKAQFQFHIDKSISSIQEYINKLVREEPESITPPSRIGDLIILELESGLNIIKFTGGPGNIGYVIPLKQDFSEVIYVIIWNPDPLFEKVISTFRFLETTTTELSRVTDVISVTVNTNKTDYEIFEEPIVSIYNNSRKTINIFFQPEHLFRVEGYINGEWKKFDTYVSNVPVSQINYGNEESSRFQNIRVRPFTTEKFNFCFCSSFNLKGHGINFGIEKEGLFRPGKYRLVVPYSFEGSDVIEYVYSNEFTVKNYKFNSAEFFCKYMYSSSEDVKSVYYSSFLNFDQDNEKELLVVCGQPSDYSYLSVLDNQNGEYRKVLLHIEMSGQRHQFSDLTVIDIDKDGLDEIFFIEFSWYMFGSEENFVIYSPKYAKEIVAASIKDEVDHECRYRYEETGEKCEIETSVYVGVDEAEFKDFVFNNPVFAQPLWYKDNEEIKLVRSLKKRFFNGQPPLSKKIIEEGDIRWLISQSDGAVYEYNESNNNFFMIHPSGANAILKKDDTLFIGLSSAIVYFNVKNYEMRLFTKSDFPGVTNKMEIAGDELIIDGAYKIPLNEFVF